MNETVMLYIFVLSGLDDIKNCKIRNSIILSGWTLGLFIRLTDDGVKGIIYGAACIIITICIALPLYRLGGIGAGDIKLWSVVALIYGIKFLSKVIVYLFILAAIVSLVYMVRKKLLLERFKNFYNYLFYGRRQNIRYYSIKKDGTDNVIPMAPITAAAYFFVLLKEAYY